LRRGSFFNIDIYILTSTVVLLFIGVLFIFSSNTSIIDKSNTNEYIKQIIWILIGIPILIFFSLSNYQNFKNIAHFI
jgi:rod shape determining protein RodA